MNYDSLDLGTGQKSGTLRKATDSNCDKIRAVKKNEDFG